jgi:hypothetical protein
VASANLNQVLTLITCWSACLSKNAADPNATFLWAELESAAVRRSAHAAIGASADLPAAAMPMLMSIGALDGPPLRGHRSGSGCVVDADGAAKGICHSIACGGPLSPTRR